MLAQLASLAVAIPASVIMVRYALDIFAERDRANAESEEHTR